MATIKVYREGETDWVKGRDMIPEERWKDYSVESLDGERRIQQPGSDVDLQMFEIRTPPNVTVETHAHAEAEIIYVIAGEISLGSHVVQAGCSVQIPGMTLYSFRTGPEGVHFLNFRARKDETYYSKDEFMAMRAATKASA